MSGDRGIERGILTWDILGTTYIERSLVAHVKC